MAMRRFLSPIAARLLLFNVLLVFLPVAALFSLRTFERQLLDLQERSMVQQGRLVAAALAADPNGVRAADARALLQRLGRRSEARIRVVDRTGIVVADSAARGIQPARDVEDAAEAPLSRERLLYRIGARLYRAVAAVRAFFSAEGDSLASSEAGDPTPRDVILKALGGRYGATLRESAGQRSLTLYSAVPVRAGGSGEVIGAVMVSQSTSRILRALWRVRLDLFEVFALSVAAAIALTLVLAATIARPLIRLRDEAGELLDHRGRLRRTFRGSRRRDEIGDLTRALEQLTQRLERHLAFVESFPADVSHEFKNPLASIRTASELLSQTDDPAQREQLAQTIDRQVARLSRLLGGVRELSKVDAAVDTEPVAEVDVCAVVRELTAGRDAVEAALPARPLLVNASEDRLLQAFGNIIENALSFSPERVRVSVSDEGGTAVVRVDDEGPGIPPEHLERIFDRFFSFRPATADPRRDHDGLGLAIARSIVEAYGGTIRAMNLEVKGARFEVRLPSLSSRA